MDIGLRSLLQPLTRKNIRFGRLLVNQSFELVGPSTCHRAKACQASTCVRLNSADIYPITHLEPPTITAIGPNLAHHEILGLLIPVRQPPSSSHPFMLCRAVQYNILLVCLTPCRPHFASVHPKDVDKSKGKRTPPHAAAGRRDLMGPMSRAASNGGQEFGAQLRAVGQ